MIFHGNFNYVRQHTRDESHDCHHNHQSSCSLEERVRTAPDDDVNKRGRIGTACKDS
jgi:hypothetical protein